MLTRSPVAVVAVGIAAFAGGFLVSRATRPVPAQRADSAVDLPVVALKEWYPPVQEFANRGDVLDDERLDALLAALDEAMTAEESSTDLERSIHPNLLGFFRRIAVPELSVAQTRRVSTYLTDLAKRYPEHESFVIRQIMTLDRYAGSTSAPPPFAESVESYAWGDVLHPEGGYFEDAGIERMLAGLDAMLVLPETVNDFEREASHLLRRFGQRLQYGQVSAEQTEQVLSYYDAFEEEHLELRETIDEARHFVKHLIPGRVAQNIVGKDLEGVEFSLEEYRGNIVVLVFSGQWCVPSRSEYPYHRFAMELYKDEPVVFLGVNSDAHTETILAAKARGDAPSYRTWWDGHSQPDADVVATDGPIAEAWDVRVWPSTFILDQEGVIRHINKRGVEFISTLDRMVVELSERS